MESEFSGLPVGFAAPATGQRARADRVPTPLPRRPKGRWFVGALLLTAVAFTGYQVWNSFFRYQAYGTVAANVIRLSPQVEGSLVTFHVREGDAVRQGQPLVTVDSLELRRRYAQLGDDLRMAQASLEAETARLKWQSAFHLDGERGAKVFLQDALGDLAREESRLDDFVSKFRRAEALSASGAVPRQELDEARFAKAGQEEKVKRMRESLAELKARAEQVGSMIRTGADRARGLADDGTEQLKPYATRVEVLQSARSRVLEDIDRGVIRAPTNGVVVRFFRLAGEHCKAGEPVVSLLEEGSLHVLLYLPERARARLAPGQEVDVLVEPGLEPLRCTVTRLGDELSPAPDSIKRHYAEGEPLLPCRLQPAEESAGRAALRAGGVVKLPYSLFGGMVR